MGAYLDTPLTEMNEEYGHGEGMYWGLCSMQGWRCNQEDDHIACIVDQADGKKGHLFAVFDGHGGKDVAEYSREKFKDVFLNSPEFKKGDFKNALI